MAGLTDDAPLYDRPWVDPKNPAAAEDVLALPPAADLGRALLELLSSPNLACKRWVYRQYDSTVRTNTLVGPGSDAAVVRIHGSKKGPGAPWPWRSTATPAGAGSTPTWARSTRWPRPAATWPPRAPCPSASPTASTSAIPRSPRSWASSVRGGARHRRRLPGARRADHRRQRLALQRDRRPGRLPHAHAGRGGCPGGCRLGPAALLRARAGDHGSTCSATRDRAGRQRVRADCCTGTVAGRPPAVDLPAEKRLYESSSMAAAAEGMLASAHDLAEGGLAVALAECCFNFERLEGDFELGGPRWPFDAGPRARATTCCCSPRPARACWSLPATRRGSRSCAPPRPAALPPGPRGRCADRSSLAPAGADRRGRRAPQRGLARAGAPPDGRPGVVG